MGISVLKDIVVIFALATLVNFLFARIKAPTIIGYLITGIIAGPYLLSLVEGKNDIELMAEVGIILLLFTIGMEFSLNHLMRIRRIVFFGGLLQVSITAGVFYLLSFFFRMTWQSGLFVGFLVALSSSAIVLKILQERSELTSNYGRTVLGILIFQDLLLVPLLLFSNLLSGESENIPKEVITLLIKALLIIVLVYASNKWLLPKILHQIAMVKNQELFIMSIFLICFSVTLLTSKLGMSLAFGAFLAGMMISESEYGHSAFGNLIPIKDIFTSFFFVSIGMLLNLQFIVDNYQLVILSVVLVIIIKTIIAGGVGFVLGHTFRGTVLVGLALSQVGEFSFILAKIGLTNTLLTSFYYQLFLAVAVITMGLTPFLMTVSVPIANTLLKLPLPKFLVNGLFPLKEMDIPDFRNHLVIIGKDNSALKLSSMAKYYNIPHVSVVFDPLFVKEKMNNGDNVVYGDAVNEPILLKAHVDKADMVVVSVGSLIPTMAIIEKIRNLNKTAHILARAKHIWDVGQLYKAGADQVLPEKLEIALDLFNRVLAGRLYSNKEITYMMNHIRNIHLGEYTERDLINKPSIFDELPSVSISAISIERNSNAVDKSIKDSDIRGKTGVTILAIKRGVEIIEHPVPATILKSDDVVYVLGNPEQISLVTGLFSGNS